jgi:hypothetical protein
VYILNVSLLLGPELENAMDRESYSLTAGLSLGIITMGQGETLAVGTLADLNLPNLLHSYMLGGPWPKQNDSTQQVSLIHQSNNFPGIYFTI